MFFCLMFIAGCQKTAVPQFTDNSTLDPHHHSGTWKNLVLAEQIINYPSGEGKFVILVVEDNEVNLDQAKQTARQKAAQVTVDNGYNYFSISSEKEIEVVKTVQPQSSQVPGNLYQELIIEKQFGRDTLDKDQPTSTNTYPAVRLTIECFVKKPLMKSVLDAKKILSQ